MSEEKSKIVLTKTMNLSQIRCPKCGKDISDIDECPFCNK